MSRDPSSGGGNPKSIAQIFQLNSLADLDKAVETLLSAMPARSLVLISGPLGVGKTKTVEVFLRKLGYEGASSPTFALHQAYKIRTRNVESQVDHFDLYRIESDDDLASAGFWDVLEKKSGLVFVEWAERLTGAAPDGSRKQTSRSFFAPGWEVLFLNFSWNPVHFFL